MPASKLPENELIARFERRLEEETGSAADLANRARLMLGLTPGHYYDLRSNRRELPFYLTQSIRFAMLLEPAAFVAMAKKGAEEF